MGFGGKTGGVSWALCGAGAFLALMTVGCDDDAHPAETDEEHQATAEPIDIDDVSLCSGCHAQVVEEWRSSMHAHAHHTADPVYAAMRELRMTREGEATAGRCGQCHGPRDPEHVDSAISRAGVTCATCHNLAGVDLAGGSRRGARALTRADGATLRGPHDIDIDGAAPHGTGPRAPWLTDGRTICLACHGALENAEGVPTCTTGTEAADTEASCTSCHMPETPGANGSATERATHRSHAFLGPHGLFRDGGGDFMASALNVSATLSRNRLSATLENRTGHAFPSGFPGRMALVRVRGVGADGEPVWDNFTDDPMTQDPDAVLNKVYVDEEGAPVMPPYAARLARDTRLRAGETRELSWVLPRAVVRAEITVLYRLLPPPAARQMGIAGQPEAQPRPILTVTVARE